MRSATVSLSTPATTHFRELSQFWDFIRRFVERENRLRRNAFLPPNLVDERVRARAHIQNIYGAAHNPTADRMQPK